MHRYVLVLSLSLTGIFTSSLPALPKVIDDNRLRDIYTSIVLGRGYDIKNNMVYQNCFSRIAQSPPSFDYKLEFQKIDQGFFDQNPNALDLENVLKKAFVREHARFKEEAINDNGRHETYSVSNLLISIVVTSYFEAFDDYNSTIHESMQDLLERGHFASFFKSCGSHYIRALGRHSHYLALLGFRNLDNHDHQGQYSDQAFIDTLQSYITQFTDELTIDKPFIKEQIQRHLRIVSEAVGVDKDSLDHIALMPKNIKALRKTIHDLIASMQDSSTGALSQIEVMPWTSNPRYLDFLVFPTEASFDRYLAQVNLRENSAIISEIERLDQAITTLRDKTSLCMRTLDEDYPMGDGDFTFDPEKTKFQAISDPGNPLKFKTLRYLKTNINDKLVSALEEQHFMFLYGNSETEDFGAIQCMNELDSDRIYEINYREIPACRQIEKFRSPRLPLINHYCLPELVDERG